MLSHRRKATFYRDRGLEALTSLPGASEALGLRLGPLVHPMNSRRKETFASLTALFVSISLCGGESSGAHADGTSIPALH